MIKHTINKKAQHKSDKQIKNRPKWLDKELNQKNIINNNIKLTQG